MRSIEEIARVERFMTRWNEEHKVWNILDLQMVLCLDDNEDKMRHLKRQLAGLNRLREDLIIEVEHHHQDTDCQSAYLSLLSQTDSKIVTLEGALEVLIDNLVSQTMTTWLDAVMQKTLEEVSNQSKKPVWD